MTVILTAQWVESQGGGVSVESLAAFTKSGREAANVSAHSQPVSSSRTRAPFTGILEVHSQGKKVV